MDARAAELVAIDFAVSKLWIPFDAEERVHQSPIARVHSELYAIHILDLANLC